MRLLTHAKINRRDTTKRMTRIEMPTFNRNKFFVRTCPTKVIIPFARQVSELKICNVPVSLIENRARYPSFFGENRFLSPQMQTTTFRQSFTKPTSKSQKDAIQVVVFATCVLSSTQSNTSCTFRCYKVCAKCFKSGTCFFVDAKGVRSPQHNQEAVIVRKNVRCQCYSWLK